MVEWNPTKWSKAGTAQFLYETLDPVYGEGAPLEEVTEQVRQGDYVGAGLEAVENVFVEPVVDSFEATLTPNPATDMPAATMVSSVPPPPFDW